MSSTLHELIYIPISPYCLTDWKAWKTAYFHGSW